MLLRRFMQHVKEQNWFAVGLDVIVVIVGIYLGIQVANWNDSRKEQEQVAIYLDRLKQDLTNQIGSIDVHIEIETKLHEVSQNMLLNFFERKEIIVDEELTSSTSFITSRKTFKKIDATYNEILNSGYLNLITDQEIKSAIVTYYQELYRIDSIITYNNNNITDAFILPTILQLIPYGEPEGFSTILFRRSGLPTVEATEDDIDRTHSKLNTAAYEIVNRPENTVVLTNAISMKMSASSINRDMLEALKKDTQGLIELLEK